jgi:hypothetical protein
LTATKNRTSLGFLALGVFLFIILLANAQAVTLGQSNLTDSIKLGSISSTSGITYNNNTYNNITIYNVTGGTYFAPCGANQYMYYLNATTIGCAQNVTLYQSSIRVRDFASDKNADYQGDELSIGDAFDYFRFRVLGAGTSAMNLSLQTGTVGNNWFDVNSKTRFNYNLTTSCVNFKDGTTQCTAPTGGSTPLTNLAWRNETNNFSKSQQFNSNVSIGSQNTSRGIFDINDITLSTIADVSTISAITFNYGDDSDYWNSGYSYHFSVYAYKTVGAQKIYSANPKTTAIAADDGGEDNSYTISFSWSAVTGAEGYRVVVWDDYYGANGDYYFDTVATSAGSDGGYGSYGGVTYLNPVVITPSSPYSSGTDIYTNSGGTLVSGQGATFNNSVGIGTTSPVSKLHVFGPNGADGSDVNIKLDIVNGGNDNGNGFINVEATSNTTVNAAGNMLMMYLKDKNPGSPYMLIENYNGVSRVGYNVIGLRQTGAAFLQTGAGLRIETGGGALGDLFTGKIGVGTVTPTAKIHIAAGTATAGTAPIKFTTGTLTTAAVAGQMEYLTNDFYLTSATGIREKIITSTGLTSGRVPLVTTNGRLIDNSNLTFNNNKLYIGGITNNITLDDINAIQLYGDSTVWDDLTFPVANTKINPATSKPDEDLNDVLYLFDDASIETIRGSGQSSHSQKNNTGLYCHVHWIQSASGIVTWNLNYSIGNLGTTTQTWYQMNSTGNITGYTTGNLQQLSYFNITAINVTGVSAIFRFKLSRLGTATTDTMVGDAKFESFDCHYEKNSLGSSSEYVK